MDVDSLTVGSVVGSSQTECVQNVCVYSFPSYLSFPSSTKLNDNLFLCFLEQILTWRAPAWRRPVSLEPCAWWRTTSQCVNAQMRVRRTKTLFAAAMGTLTATHVKWRPWDAPFRNRYRCNTKDHVVSPHTHWCHSLPHCLSSSSIPCT